MSSELTPEDVASRSFSHSLRGYDPSEVRTYLESVADQLRRLHRQYLAARQELGALEDEEVSAQIDSATSDINELLQSARVAAEQMRDRAARESSTTTSRSEAAATETLARSEADAAAMRQAAWDTSTDMLEQVRAEYARLRQQADRDALAILGEAERDAHKKLATARRDSENKSRAARLETERLLVDARAARDEMMDMAERSTEAAQERTRALERRREELMAELEDLRLQREAPPDPVGRGVSTTVRVVSAGEPSGTEVPSIAPVPDPAPAADWIDDEDLRVVAPLQHAPWADGSETVRLVKSPLPAEDDMDVDADDVAGEVARLHAEAETAHLIGEPSDAEREPALTDTDRTNTDRTNTDRTNTDRPDTVWPDIEMDAPDAVTDLPVRESIDREVLEPSPERDLAKAWSASDSRPIETGDDLGSLFRELRVDDQVPDGVEGEVSDLASVRAEDNISEDTPLEALIPEEPVTAFDLRDRALLPITNRGLRDVKRQLADVQNLQLDALKRRCG